LQGYGKGIQTRHHRRHIKILCTRNKDLDEQFRNNFNVKLKYLLLNRHFDQILLKCPSAT
jgi:hypothetical protein